MISGRRFKLFAVIFGFTLLVADSFAGDRGVPASEGIGNFGKVSATLYRGAQPDEAGIKNLKTLGITTIINLREPKDVIVAEEKQARANGILYTNLPFAGMGRPTDADVAKVLAVINNSTGAVFIHCQHGCDRTGTIVACYRIQHDHWTGATAMIEAEKFGISRLERGMRRYITDFATAAQKQASATMPAKP